MDRIPDLQAEIDHIKAGTPLSAIISASLPLKRQGRELMACCPFHGEKTPSFSVDDGKGFYHCFGCGAHGDVFDWLQKTAGMKLVEAIDHLNGRAVRTSAPAASSPPPADPAPQWVPILPVPADAPSPPAAHPKYGAPVHVARYLDRDGALLGLIYRHEPAGERKQIPTLTYCENGDGRRAWRWQAMPKPRSLYGAELLSGDARVLIVEGEPKCDAARRLLGGGMIVVAWPGGAKAVQHVDWSLLAGRDVAIWPDADTPGADAAAFIARRLLDLSAAVHIVSLPDDVPEGWDLADAEREGWTGDRVLEQVEVVTPTPNDDDAPPPGETDPNYLNSLAADINQSPVDAVLAEFNRRYMVVNENGRAVIYAPAFDPVLKRERFDRITFEDLRRFHLNRRVKIGEDEKGKSITKGAADIWLTHRDRRQYLGGVTFDPSGREYDDGVLNLWKGFSTKPAPGSWSLMRQHIQEIICDRDHDRFDYLMGWMARMIQQPATPGEVAVVMKGVEGCGKGTLANALMVIIGYHALAISNSKHLTGNFNAHLRDVVFLFADEAFFAGDKASIGTLKALVTEPNLTVEAKYQNAVQLPNFLHIIMASNEEWVVPASLESRRFFVLDVPSVKKGNYAYFAKIMDQMRAGGYEAMLHDLLAYDLSQFNVRDVLATDGLQDQKKLSLGTTDAWWMEVLHRGYVLQSKHGIHEYFGVWLEDVSTELLYASYSQFASKRHERHPLSRESLGREMRRLGGRPKRLQNAVIGEHVTDVDTGFGNTSRRGQLLRHPRPQGYHLGTLDISREAFDDATHLQVVWEDDGDD